MAPVVRVLGDVTLGIVLGSVAFNVLAYAAATHDRRRRAVPCPFAAADDVVPWSARTLAWLAAFARECAVTAALTCTVPLALRRARVRAIGAGNPCRPVILLHGYAQHTANFLWLTRRLRRDGWLHLYSVRHTALWGDIERSGARLAAVIDRIRSESGAAEVDVVAHSMGGLVARAAVRGGARGVRRIVTLGTPHQGTAILGSLAIDPMVAQMRPGSPFLRRLAADDPVPATTEVISIYSVDDALIVPPANACYPGALNIEVRGVGHMSMLFSRRIYELVRENLAAEPEARAAAPAAGLPG